MSRDKVYFLAPVRTGGWTVKSLTEPNDTHPKTWRGPYATKADARNAITANPSEPPQPSKWMPYRHRRDSCTKCGQHVSLTRDWTLWPWPDGAQLCANCNDTRHEEEEYP